MFQAGVSKFTLESDAVSSDEEPQPKKSKLFSFMVVPHSSHKKKNITRVPNISTGWITL